MQSLKDLALMVSEKKVNVKRSPPPLFFFFLVVFLFFVCLFVWKRGNMPMISFQRVREKKWWYIYVIPDVINNRTKFQSDKSVKFSVKCLTLL